MPKLTKFYAYRTIFGIDLSLSLLLCIEDGNKTVEK